MNKKLGEQSAPTVWWFALPFGGYWWAWQYSQAVEKATKSKIRYPDIFGYFIIATMGVIGAFWLPDPNLAWNNDSAVDGSVWIAWGVIVYFLTIIVLGVFPAAMQNRFNKLPSK